MQEINLIFRNSVGKFSARNGYSFFRMSIYWRQFSFFNYFMQNPWVVMYPHIFNNFLVGHKFQAILVELSLVFLRQKYCGGRSEERKVFRSDQIIFRQKSRLQWMCFLSNMIWLAQWIFIRKFLILVSSPVERPQINRFLYPLLPDLF